MRVTEELIDMIRRHEGNVLHAYQDSEGYWTIGTGRLIDKRRSGGITEQESRILLEHDIQKVRNDLVNLFGKDLPVNITELRSNALCDMRFQLGYNGFREFQRMIRAVRDGDWNKAADEALSSLWAQQTPDRAQEIAEMLRNG